MNKLIIDSNIYEIVDYEGFITINTKETKLNIRGNCKLYILDNNSILNIEIFDNSSLEIYLFTNNKVNDTYISVDQNNNTNLELIDLYSSNYIIKESIINNIKGNNNKSNIIISVIQNQGESQILEQINALENTKENEASESLKGLTCGGNIVTLPNMQISTNNIVANHFVTISGFNNKELLYLQQKGIDLKTAKSLIKKGYLFSGLDKTISEVFLDE